jgi:hypothetical protein
MALGVAAVVHLRDSGNAPGPVEGATTTSVLSIYETTGAAAPSITSLASRSASSVSAPAASKSRYVDRFSKTGSPTDAFVAYQVLRHCVNVRNDQANIATRVAAGKKPPTETVDSACGDLDSGRIGTRLQLLRQATRAGVHGAASSLLDEGPGGFGNAIPRAPDDPDLVALVKESQDAIAVGAAHGDWWSLWSTSGNYEQAGDYVAALQYAVAADDSYRAENGAGFRGYQRMFARLGARLNNDQVAPAVDAGHQIYLNSQSVR